MRSFILLKADASELTADSLSLLSKVLLMNADPKPKWQFVFQFSQVLQLKDEKIN